jgi:predicted regulator of Ras-like GTPase activity (Roadblock/LC7/MglB family)
MRMLSQQQLSFFEDSIKNSLIDKGVSCVLLIDLAGNIIANLDNGMKRPDIYSLAALAAGNYGAVNAMADIVGEKDFSLLFHKGEDVNIHFKSITTEYLLISIFGNDMSLGFLRLKVAEAEKKIKYSLKPGAK